MYINILCVVPIRERFCFALGVTFTRPQDLPLTRSACKHSRRDGLSCSFVVAKLALTASGTRLVQWNGPLL